MVCFLDDKPLSGCRILIVEDDYLLAQTIVDTVEGAGAKAVGPFARMIEALEGMTVLGAVDGAILDIGLGDETSYPLAEALQTTGIPFIFLTGTERLKLPARFERTGHLLKPHTETALIEALAKLDMSRA